MKILPFPTLALLGSAWLLSTSCAPAQTEAPPAPAPDAPAQAGGQNQNPGARPNRGQGQNRRNGQGQGQNQQGRQGQGQNRQNGQGQNGQGQNGQGLNRQNVANQPGNVTGDATAFAQIPASNRRVAVPPPNAPQDVALKASTFPVPAGAIYTSPTAKANGTGAQNSPMTLKNALQNAPAGGTVVLRGGVYREGGLVIARKITLQSAPGEVAWIDGSEVVSGWNKDGDLWKRTNWETTFPRVLEPQHIDPAYPLSNNRDMVWIGGRYLTQVATRGEVGPGKFCVDYEGKTLFIGDDPSGKVVEATTQTNGLMFRGRDAEAAAGSVVRGLGFRRFAEAGVNIQVPRVTLDGCTSVWNGRYGVHIMGTGPGGEKPSDVVLRGINASCNGQAGVRTWQTPRLLVENSTFSHNNIEGYRTAWGAAGIKVLNFDGFVFRGNTVSNNYAFGLWLDENLNDAVVVNNRASGNEVAGMMFEISHRDVFAFNTLHDNNVGIMVSNSTQGQFWNNTFSGNRNAIQVKQGRRPNHQTPEEGDVFLTRDIALGNNLFTASDPKAALIDAGTGSTPAPQMISASDFNVFAPAGPVALAKWKTGPEATQNFADLAAFRAASGLEKNSVQVGAIAFAAPQNGDFRPKAPLQARPQVLPAEVAKAAGVSPNVNFVGALAPAR